MLYHLSQLCNLLVLALQLLLKLSHLASIQKLVYSFLVLLKDTLPYLFLPDLFDALFFGVFFCEPLRVIIEVVFIEILANLVFRSVLIRGISRLIACERVLIDEAG